MVIADSVRNSRRSRLGLGVGVGVGVWGCALAAIGLCGPGQVPAAYAASRVDGTVDRSSVQMMDNGSDGADLLQVRIADALDVFRRAAADAALGHPVMYGNGQCSFLIQQYMEALGYAWQYRSSNINTFDLYEHFATNGLGEFFEQIPFDGGMNDPQVGDVVVYGAGGYVSEYGHAGVVMAVGSSGSSFRYETADQNADDRLYVTTNWRDFSPAWNTLGYLRPKV